MKWPWVEAGVIVVILGACGPNGAVADGDADSGGESADDGGTSLADESTGNVDASTSADTTSAQIDSSSDGSSESGEPVALCLHSALLEEIEGTSEPIVVADVDGDGRPELWGRSEDWDPFNGVLTQHLTAYAASPDGSAVVIADATFEGSFVRFADIDGDGRDDVVARPIGSTESWFWLAGRDDATFGADPQPLPLPPPLPDSTQWHDADADGDVDIFTLEFDEPGVALWLGDGAGGFALADSIPIDTPGWVDDVVPTPEPGVFILDADDAGLGFGNEATLWRVSVAADGTLSTSAHTGQAPQELREARDLDGDDATDLLVLYYDTQQVHAWRAVEGAYEDVLVADGRNPHVGDFIAEGSVQVLLQVDDEQVALLHAPLDPAGAQTPVEGALDSDVHDEIDVDGDGRSELLQRIYVSEKETDYAIVEVVPCE